MINSRLTTLHYLGQSNSKKPVAHLLYNSTSIPIPIRFHAATQLHSQSPTRAHPISTHALQATLGHGYRSTFASASAGSGLWPLGPASASRGAASC